MPKSDLAKLENIEQHIVRSRPWKSENGWRVSFVIMPPTAEKHIYRSFPEIFGEIKATLEDAHQVGFAMARVIISRHPPEHWSQFSDAERRYIEDGIELIKQWHLRLKREGLAERPA